MTGRYHPPQRDSQPALLSTTFIGAVNDEVIFGGQRRKPWEHL
jgi:hypothetical protein